mgnify:FL=1
MTVVQIFDKGQVFSSSVLDVTDDELVGRVAAAIKQVAGISLAVNYPTIASIMHSFVNSYKKVLFTSIATDYEYEGSAKIKEILANPEAFAAASTAAAPAAAAEAPKEEAKEEAKEEEDDSDEDMGFALFD